MKKIAPLTLILSEMAQKVIHIQQAEENQIED